MYFEIDAAPCADEGRTPIRSRHAVIRPLRPRHLAVAWLATALACGSMSRAIAQAAIPQGGSSLTTSQVISRMVAENAARAKALESYRGRRTYTLFYKGFPSDLHAQMVVDMTYTAPNIKTFVVVSKTGPKWIQDQVLTRLLTTEQDAQQAKNRSNVDLNTENYNFTDSEYQAAADHCSYSIHVEPKTRSRYLYRGTIWINDRDFAVCRMEVQPARNPSLWIKSTKISHSYEQVGEFWLPRKNESVSAIRIGGRATLTIEYQNYKILAAKPLTENFSGVAAGKAAD